MLLKRGLVREDKDLILEEDITFDKSYYENDFILKDIKSCHVIAKARFIGDDLNIQVNITGILVLKCCYTLELFDYKFKTSDEINLVDHEDISDGSSYYDTSSVINLDKYIYSIVYCEVPISPKKPGAKLPKY